ncbi:MAG: amidase [Acidimicrobiia bacterium]|nr:amidase [Acidimicrobiia bacterium]
MGDPFAILDATAQADLVRRGEVTPVELVDAAIARIEALNEQLNAVVLPRFERAHDDAMAEVPDGPFRGVPFLTKDLGCPTAGERQTEGMRFLKDAGYIATQTARLAERFRGAGFINLGRTNSPELGLVPTTEPEAWGATHNPWDRQRSSGGSSGGSAAAVAAGLVPIAHASDGGGSIRIPASACGLVGLKPSRGRVSQAPGPGELSNFLSVQLGVCRSVRDAATLLDVAAGAEVGDPMTLPAPARPYRDLIGRSPGNLRVGVMIDAPGGATAVHPECVTAVTQASKLLEALGHHVESSHPNAFDDPDRGRLFGTVWAVRTATQLATWSAAVGRAITIDDVEPNTWAMAEMGRAASAVDYFQSVNAIQVWSRAMAGWWHDGFDLLLTPTLAEPPAPLGTFTNTREQPFQGSLRAGPYTPFTPAINLTGQPAISLPLHRTPDGLPIGVHLVAANGREDLLIAVAAQLETAAPWAEQRPAMHA